MTCCKIFVLYGQGFYFKNNIFIKNVVNFQASISSSFLISVKNYLRQTQFFAYLLEIAFNNTLCLMKNWSFENVGYPNRVLIWVVIKINDKTVSQSTLAGQRRFNSFKKLPFNVLLFYIRRLLVLKETQSTYFYLLLIKFKPNKNRFSLYF